MRIDDNDFELFGIEASFSLDRARLDARWKALQGEVHPDRFVAEGAAAQRVAMQWAIRVNEAYRRLKDPLQRAAYLCELNGQAIGAENNTAMPAAFLMQQMAWRESLDEARTLAAVEGLADQVAARQRTLLDEMAVLIDERHDWPAATAQVRALMFITRFSQDVDRRLDADGA
ncbi:co-chaperone Hsc20 [Leptothrix cholodnii SP-6]|uniref:Co-chaperone protein HscB homolog n=1 Tax=Leptothrix cholodnii (strain ATCC 51168 / LMG 8142 / SP-6) TaxID=395495 RepID=B1Y776_LEPCP|nr:Fe-S protein assembly co-chaperone HscB [Leptothrix cholodnii]ACB33703.1 co-chaperone Hsc20 [Leptothrix cholodnii SP-6]